MKYYYCEGKIYQTDKKGMEELQILMKENSKPITLRPCYKKDCQNCEYYNPGNDWIEDNDDCDWLTDPTVTYHKEFCYGFKHK